MGGNGEGCEGRGQAKSIGRAVVWLGERSDGAWQEDAHIFYLVTSGRSVRVSHPLLGLSRQRTCV